MAFNLALRQVAKLPVAHVGGGRSFQASSQATVEQPGWARPGARDFPALGGPAGPSRRIHDQARSRRLSLGAQAYRTVVLVVPVLAACNLNAGPLQAATAGPAVSVTP